MAAVYTSKHVVMVWKDGTGTPLTYTPAPTPMDVTIAGIEQNGCEVIKVMNNGTFYELVEGPQKEVPFSITIYQDGELVDGSTAKPMNFVTKAGTVAAGVTGDPGGTGGVWTVAQVVLTSTRNAVTTVETLTNCRLIAERVIDPAGNQIKISGIAYGTGSTLPYVVTS